MAPSASRTLVLLRHARSAWPDVPDHDRPLAPRGRRDAPVVGRWLRTAGYLSDWVMCSTARRARQTWQLAGSAPQAGAGSGDNATAAAMLGRMRTKFPTAAIAVFECTGNWDQLAPGRARLACFVIPRELRGR